MDVTGTAGKDSKGSENHATETGGGGSCSLAAQGNCVLLRGKQSLHAMNLNIRLKAKPGFLLLLIENTRKERETKERNFNPKATRT